MANSLAADKSALEEEKLTLERTVTSLTNENLQPDADLGLCEADFTTQTSLASTRLETINSLNDANDDLTEQLADMTIDRERLQALLNTCNSKLDTQTSLASTRLETINSLNAAKDPLTEQLAQTTANFNACDNERTNLNGQV